MDELTGIRQLIVESEAQEQARADETWSLLLDNPESGLGELIAGVGIKPLEVRQVLTNARIGDQPALYLVALGRNEEVHEALLRMLHGHYKPPSLTESPHDHARRTTPHPRTGRRPHEGAALQPLPA